MTKRILPAVLAITSLTGAELPVKRVVLYKHGVGYFERAGNVASSETARLDFRPEEMNDVLKSLIIEERSGGKVSGVRYDSATPVRNPVQVDAEMPLAQFLDRLRGAKVEIELGTSTLKGSILSGRVVKPTEEKAQQELLVLLTDGGDLRTVDLSSATTIRLTDPSLQSKLREYLESIAGLRTQEQRTVYIDGDGSRARQLRASYLLPTPTWKSSYRLILGESPVLEGWAIVDNTTESDWNGISLSLVSGKPISFQSRLYDPQFVERPFAELPEQRALAPQLYAGAMTAEAAEPPSPAPESMPKAARFGSDRRMVQSEALAAGVADAMEIAPSAVDVDTGSRDLGELFEYSYSNPVTVKKHQSAMLPFLQQKIEARRLLIYSDERERNPRTASEISNTTGKTLDGGPITVFDNGAYAGEALVETVRAGDKRLVSYGVDLGTRITTAFHSGSKEVLEVHAANGVLRAKASTEETKTYTVRNVDAKPKTLIIEHPVRKDYVLAGVTPIETTDKAYRFSVPLRPQAEERFVVREQRINEEVYYLTSATPDQIQYLLRNRSLSGSARAALEKVLALKSDIAAADARLRNLAAQIGELDKDQARLRANIQSLSAVSGQQQQVQRYAEDLAAREVKIVQLRDASEAERQRKAALESELHATLAKLTF